MNVEKELKEQCTPEFIKWMCEMAEGFSISGHQIYTPYLSGRGFNLSVFTHNGIFPLLIHRAVEGWNKKHEIELVIRTHGVVEVIESEPIKEWNINNYQPQTLTPAECALLHCLLDIFKDIS